MYHYDENFHFFFIGQGDEFISCSGQQPSVPAFGSRVRIKGTVRDGRVKPVCLVESLEILDDDPKPQEPEAIKLDHLLLGAKDCHFVSVSALIEHVRLGMENTIFGCRQGAIRFDVAIDERIEAAKAIDYVGAQIKVTGNLGADFENGEATGFEVISNLDAIEILAHVTRLKHAPLRTVNEIWLDEETSEFHISGQVTYKNKAGFLLQTTESGTWVYNDTGMELSVGSFLEIYGTRDEQKDLYVRVFKNKGSFPLTRPSLADISDVISAGREGRRVQLHGDYISSRIEGHAGQMMLDVQGRRVQVTLLAEQLKSLNLKTAKEVTVTGTASFYSNTTADVALYTPSLDDIVVIRRTQWSSTAIATGIATALGLLGLCIYWATNLSKQVQQKRRDLEKVSAELKLSYESIREGIIILDLDNRVSYANGRAAEVLGTAIPVGMPIDHLRGHFETSHANDEFLLGWDLLNGSRSEVRELELELVSKDDQQQIIEAFSSPVNNASGEFVNRLWTFHDVTERKQLHDSLTHAQKQEAVGRLASGFAHDFNNLLTGITCSLGVVKADPTKTVAEASACIDTALSASERAASLVSQILCFSRKRPLNFETSSVNQIIERAANLLSPSLPPDTELQCKLEPKTPLVEVDGTQLEQVLLNLLLNASDAIEGAGQITVSTYAETKNEQPYAVISIHDTGCGMKPATRAKIFEPYYTSKESGTGLGLSMSQGIIQQHGGHIECDSVPSVGSEFRIYLPAKTEVILPSDSSGDSDAMQSLSSPKIG